MRQLVLRVGFLTSVKKPHNTIIFNSEMTIHDAIWTSLLFSV